MRPVNSALPVPVDLHIDELVLSRRRDEPLGELAGALARALASHGVPDPAHTAAAILDQVDGAGRP